MKSYVMDTYHGPLVLCQRAKDWVICSPYRPPEIYSGSIPPSCMPAARRISLEEAVEILGDCSLPLWSDQDLDFGTSGVFRLAS